MARFPLVGLLMVVMGNPAAAQQKAEPPEKNVAAPLLYTIRSYAGVSQTSRDRQSVLKTVKMTGKQILEWAEDADEKAVKERRTATAEHGTYFETISRGEKGELLYTLLDEGGKRVSRARQSLLKTKGWTADKIKTWVDAPEGKDQGRVFIQDGSRVRAAFYRSEYVELISREPTQARNELLEAPEVKSQVE
jgi:hypothetical protein